MEVILFLLTGVIAGTLSGLFGIGGGVIIVPSLLLAFNLQHIGAAYRMHMAVATSLSIIVVTACSSLLTHWHHGNQFWSVYRRWAVGVIIGTLVGATLAHHLHSDDLKFIFAIVLFLMALKMLLLKHLSSHGKLPGVLPMNGVGLVIGAKSGLLGLGGGALAVPFLTFWHLDMRQAAAVSVATSATVSLFGTIMYIVMGSAVTGLPHWSVGYVYLPAWITVSIGSVLCAPLGVKLARKISTAVLKKIFGVILMLIALHMLFA